MSANLAPTNRDPSPRGGPAASAAGHEQRTPDETTARPPPGRRFADVLRRVVPVPQRTRRPEAPGTAPATPLAAGLAPRDTVAPPRPGPAASAAPDFPSAVPRGLADVEAAWGAEGAALRFTVEDGSLAGLRMAFFLRGDTLDVTLDASVPDVQARLAAREDDVRETLAGHGIELGRYDADGEGSRREGGADDGAPGGPAARRRPGAPVAAGGSGRDYVR